MYIVFEWLDGAWKDTQLRNVFKYISERNKHKQILKTQEPTWITKYWKEISEKLKGEWFKTPKEALNLYVKDRVSISQERNIWISKGYAILSSRGDYTTYAYQSIDNEKVKWFSFDEIREKHKKEEKLFQVNIPKPDITFFFDLPIEETMNRINSRLKEWEKKDFFEKKEFLEKARTQYLKSIKYLKDKEKRKIYIIDANKTPDEVFSDVKKILDNYDI